MVRGVRSRRDLRRDVRSGYKKVFVPRHTFDMAWAEMAFPKEVTGAHDDTELTNVNFDRLLYNRWHLFHP